MEDIPPEQQVLIYSGKHLEDGRNLADHFIGDEARLQLDTRDRLNNGGNSSD